MTAFDPNRGCRLDSTWDASTSAEQAQLQEFSRLVQKVEAFLLAIVLLSLFFAGVDAEDNAAISAALFFYAAFALAMRFATSYRGESRWTIALATSAMIPFITWATWYTDKFASPLFNAYLVIVITTALTRGTYTLVWQLGLIGGCFALLSETFPTDLMSSIGYLGGLLTQLTPLVIVAYVTSVFSADIRFWMNRARLRVEIDGLTGLPNLRGFTIAADRLLARAARDDAPISLMAVDAGGVNEGENARDLEAGSELLRRIAKSIAGELRRGDILARSGRSEFIALLAETGTDGAPGVAERTRMAVSRAISAQGTPRPALIGVGIAARSRNDRGVDALLTRAVRAMQVARERGGDSVEVSSAPTGSSRP